MGWGGGDALSLALSFARTAVVLPRLTPARSLSPLSTVKSESDPGKIQVSPENNLLLIDAGFHELKFHGTISIRVEGEMGNYYVRAGGWALGWMGRER